MRTRSDLLWLLAAVLLAGTGLFLRFHPWAAYRRAGFDEILYRNYVFGLEQTGLSGYDALTAHYLTAQRKPEAAAELPPTRFLYILAGTLWKRAQFGAAPPVDLRTPGAFERDPILVSLRRVAALFTSGLLLLSGLAAWRWAGRGAGLGVLALMAFAPLQIHLSQHSMIDGFFAFWAGLALWALWENLQRPNHPGWLALLGVAGVALVLTKENAFFVCLALAVLVAANRWLRLGQVTPALVATGIIGPLLGLVLLINLAGGPSDFFETYRLLVSQAEKLPYAIETGDGPWYRYLVDLMILCPLILCLAIGGAFCVPGEKRAWLYLVGFLVLTFAVMCNVRYGMNLRYTAMWDFPLRCLAWAQLVWLGRLWRLPPAFFLPLAVTGLCLHELWQYHTFFVAMPLYELGPADLLHAIRMLK